MCCGRSCPSHALEEESETESEEQEERCQASAIAYVEDGSTVPLCTGCCDTKATGLPMTLLYDDVEYSNKPELIKDGRNYTALLCQSHFNQNEFVCLKRKCTIADCYQFGTRGEDGIPLCSFHRADRALSRKRSKSPAIPEAHEGEDVGPEKQTLGVL